jgi:xanthine dehydrogenase accessory factor
LEDLPSKKYWISGAMFMVERGEIVKLWRSRQDSSGVLVSLVRVEGSSYRRPGARMYVQSRAYTGSISGGCLEGEIVRKATWLTRAGAAIERYSTRFDNPFDESTGTPDSNSSIGSEFATSGDIPYGLGCGGVMDVLLEPVAAPETEAFLLALEAAQNGKTFACATVLPDGLRSTFARTIVDENGEIFFASAGLDSEIVTHLSRLAREANSPQTVSISGNGETCDMFLEPILPPQRLVIFGAGEDARPLTRMAHLMGWRITVADSRGWLAQPARFPEADQVLVLGRGKRDLDALHLSNRDAVAILTHSFDQDRNLLPQLLPLDLRYLGLLGARHRSQLLLTQTARQLGWTPEECLRRVHAPMGLDLGGDSPEAVALTVIAEIQSVLHEKSVVSRRMSQESLQAAPARPYIPVQCPLDDVATSSDAAQFIR